MLHPFPPVICFHTTAVPVLCSQLLVIEVCTELVQSGLLLLVAVSLVVSFTEKMGLSLPLFRWDQLLYAQEPEVANLYPPSTEGVHHMNLGFFER